MAEQNNKELTKAELQLMNLLWDKQEAFVNDLLDELPEPKPAYNTVSTFIRILVQKGFVGYKQLGKSHKYYPLVKKEEYLSGFMNNIKQTLFKGSFSSLVSFFAENETLTQNEIDELIAIINSHKK